MSKKIKKRIAIITVLAILALSTVMFWRWNKSKKVEENTTTVSTVENDDSDNFKKESEEKEENNTETTNENIAETANENDNETEAAEKPLRPSTIKETIKKEQSNSVVHIHSYEKSTVLPTCTDKGYNLYKCSCGDFYTSDYVPVIGHKYVETVIEPTCTEEGYTIHKCSECGEEYIDSKVPAKGHDFEIEITDATCEHDKIEKHKCKECGYEEKIILEQAKGHTFLEDQEYCLNGCGIKNPDFIPAEIPISTEQYTFDEKVLVDKDLVVTEESATTSLENIKEGQIILREEDGIYNYAVKIEKINEDGSFEYSYPELNEIFETINLDENMQIDWDTIEVNPGLLDEVVDEIKNNTLFIPFVQNVSAAELKSDYFEFNWETDKDNNAIDISLKFNILKLFEERKNATSSGYIEFNYRIIIGEVNVANDGTIMRVNVPYKVSTTVTLGVDLKYEMWKSEREEIREQIESGQFIKISELVTAYEHTVSDIMKEKEFYLLDLKFQPLPIVQLNLKLSFVIELEFNVDLEAKYINDQEYIAWVEYNSETNVAKGGNTKVGNINSFTLSAYGKATLFAGVNFRFELAFVDSHVLKADFKIKAGAEFNAFIGARFFWTDGNGDTDTETGSNEEQNQIRIEGMLGFNTYLKIKLNFTVGRDHLFIGGESTWLDLELLSEETPIFESKPKEIDYDYNKDSRIISYYDMYSNSYTTKKASNEEHCWRLNDDWYNTYFHAEDEDRSHYQYQWIGNSCRKDGKYFEVDRAKITANRISEATLAKIKEDLIGRALTFDDVHDELFYSQNISETIPESIAITDVKSDKADAIVMNNENGDIVLGFVFNYLFETNKNIEVTASVTISTDLKLDGWSDKNDIDLINSVSEKLLELNAVKFANYRDDKNNVTDPYKNWKAIKKEQSVLKEAYWAIYDFDNNGEGDKLVLGMASEDSNALYHGKMNLDEETEGIPSWVENSQNVNSAIVMNKIMPVSINYWFAGVGISADNLTIDVSNLLTDQTTQMEGAFKSSGENSKTITIKGLEKWKTYRVVTMRDMFAGTGKKSTDWNISGFENWNVSKVEDMSGMFKEAGQNATTFKLLLSNWKTPNLTSISREGNSMFEKTGNNSEVCKIYITNFDISNVSSLNGWFLGACENSKDFKIDVSNLDFRNITSHEEIFDNSGKNATDWEIRIPNTTGEKHNNEKQLFVSEIDSEKYISAPEGRKFTLSKPLNIPSDAILNNINNHYYKVYGGRKNWDEAKIACESFGGYLATITSEEEQNFIESINNSRVWIGGYRTSGTTADWQWVTDEEFSYTNWGEGEPNNSSNVISNENRISVWPKKWNDLNNASGEQGGYICEWR